ncbi:TolC family protein [Pedobacter gandavensis]|uniref:TolC family protein n=1 Tax=Pedobacter gandavensis TaxID=2679963 RepID=UPI00292DCF06|nr:TolC family protein [Pedobacter gandavensis]
MMKNPLYLTGILLVLSGIPGYSQTHKELSLSHLWELTAEQYPLLAEKQAKIGESEYRKRELQNMAIPQVQLQLQNSFGTFEGTNGAFFPVPGIFNVSGKGASDPTGLGTTMNSFGSILMDWKVSQFGKQQKMIAAAGFEVQEARSNYEASKLSLLANATSRYLDLLYTGSGRKWADKNTKRVKEILELSVSLAEAGLKPGADTALAAATYLQAQAELEDWNGKYQAGQIKLKELAPALVADQVLPLKKYMNTCFTVEKLDAVGVLHPFLQILDKQLMVQQLQREVIGKKQLPSISLLAGFSARGTGINADGTVQNNYSSGYNNGAQNYLVGLGLSWNLSNLYTGSLEKKRAQKQVDAAKSRYQLQKLQMNTNLQAVTSRIQAQIRQVEKTEEAVLKTINAYELYLSRYEAGLINLTDLLQIQSLLQQVEKSNIEVHQALWTQLNTKAELSGDYSFLFHQFK